MKLFLAALVSMLLGSAFISSCSKDCTPTINKQGVNQSYLQPIIPYSDTSSRLFLKNGKDTIRFFSQGLKETFEDYGKTNGCTYYSNQKYSMSMSVSDSEYFKINYYLDYGNFLVNDYEVIGDNFYSNTKPYSSVDYVSYFPQIKSVTVLNNTYDSIKILFSLKGDTVISRPNIGVLKIKSNGFIYELIK
jgi:hypothetical protein